MKAILVTGSRALAKTPHEPIVRRILEEYLVKTDVLFHGACPDSPDAWAEEIAEHHNLPRLLFYADGRLESIGYHTPIAWFLERHHWLEYHEQPHPLLRNERMVKRFREAHPNGIVLGFEALWSRSHGTAMTLAVAKREQLHVCRHTYELLAPST